MKLFILLAAVTWAEAAKLDRVYLPPNARASAGSANFLQTPHHSIVDQVQNDYAAAAAYNTKSYAPNVYSGYDAPNQRTQATLERNAAILRQDNSNDGETFSYAYETDNGIYAEESGVATNGVQAQGGYSYTGDDGKVYSVRYTADENGFVPQGDHLPTPPPIPEEIMQALEKNARDEAAGIYDDGSYTEAKYASSNAVSQYYNTNAQPINAQPIKAQPINAQPINAQPINAQPINNYNDDSIVTNSVASLRNVNGFNRNSVEKTYLPPFVKRNRNYNARTGYNY